MRGLRPINIAVVVILAIACFLLAWPQGNEADASTCLTLPNSIPGFAVQDLPVANTPEMKKAVAELLDYDWGLLREYRSPAATVLVYAAFWRPGKMPPRMITNHTPDICWVENGWIRRAELEIDAGPLIAVEGRVGITPGKYRLYEQNGRKQHVVWWHRYGDNIIDYRFGGAGLPLVSVIKDFKAFGFMQKKAQIFVRISSDVPITAVFDNVAFKPLIEDLRRMGLAKPLLNID